MFSLPTEALLHQFLGTTPAGLLTANEVDGTASATAAAGMETAVKRQCGPCQVKEKDAVIQL
jgi:hypothetical protein